MKVTAVAPSNIAFIKYWGRKDEDLKLPANASISMNLSGLMTTTTVEFDSSLQEDEFYFADLRLQGQALEGVATQGDPLRKVTAHLDRIRKLAGINEFAKVVSENNFPRGTGLSSSASGFAALTLAATKAAGLDLSEKELSILARQGSGSACRSIPDGFVEWVDGDTSDTSYAVSLYKPDYWDIVDIVAILTDQVKDVSTTEGQKLAFSSPFYEVRQQKIKDKISKIKTHLKDKNFKAFGEIVEAESLELHAIMLTSNPSLIYWYPATITVMKAVQKWRREGLECYFTLNTGQNIHVICQKQNFEEVKRCLSSLSDVKDVIVNSPSTGAHTTETHLF